MGTLLPQRLLILLWPHHRLASPRLLQLPTPQTCCSRSCCLHHHRCSGGDHQRGCQGTPNQVGKLICDPSPQVCNLDHVVTKHTSTAVYEAPDPIVDSV